MAAGRYDITIEQGATFDLPISYKDSTGSVLDLSSGYSAKMKIKESIGGTVIASTESEDDPKNTLTITLAASGNNITIGMTAANTASLDFENAVYDLELISTTDTTRVIEGKVKLSKEVTV